MCAWHEKRTVPSRHRVWSTFWWDDERVDGPGVGAALIRDGVDDRRCLEAAAQTDCCYFSVFAASAHFGCMEILRYCCTSSGCTIYPCTKLRWANPVAYTSVYLSSSPRAPQMHEQRTRRITRLWLPPCRHSRPPSTLSRRAARLAWRSCSCLCDRSGRSVQYLHPQLGM